MNAEPEMLWGLPVVAIESMPRDEIIIFDCRILRYRIFRAEDTQAEEDARLVARLSGIREVVVE